MSIFKTHPNSPTPAQEHAALFKSADPMVRAMRDPAGRAEIPAKCEKPKFGLVPAESLCSSFPTFEAPLPIDKTVSVVSLCECSQKTEETALKSDSLGTGSNLHIWLFLGAEAGSEQTHPQSQTISTSKEAGSQTLGWMRLNSLMARIFRLRTDHQQNLDPPGIQPNLSGMPKMDRS
ncbi:hypothetical protein B0H13DRAFT_1899168 [Mycena leptocephala]|nr:hypothetical protein B0H13DRAFT_1899168 [Mycena leptocephala]